jgi:small-conductance mechanosensitive channel
MIGLIRFLFVIAVLFSSPSAWSQVHLGEPFTTWGETAVRAQEALEKREASNAALEQLRSQLTDQRADALGLSEAGSVKVRTLRAQLDALGPEPKDDGSEPDAIASRRSELKSQIATANAPILAAQEAFQRADVLITELDELIRDRETRRLLSRSPSPVLPSSWNAAATELSAYAERLRRELRQQLEAPAEAAQVRERSPFVLLFFMMGVLVLTLGQRLVLRRIEHALATASSIGQTNWFAIVRGVAHLLAPLLGAALIVFALQVSTMSPNSARTLLAVFPIIAFVIVVGHWLGHMLFAPTMPQRRLVGIEQEKVKTGLRLCQALSITLAAEITLEAIGRDFAFSAAAEAVVAAPIIITGSVLLWRLSRLLHSAGQRVHNECPETQQVSTHFMALLSRLMQLSAVVAPILALVGYIPLAREAILPMLTSIGLLGASLLVFHAIIIVLAPVIGSPESDAGETQTGSTSLVPIVVVCVIGLCLLPLLALVWGARTAEITEVWVLLTDGVKFGETRISLEIVVIVAAVFGIGMFLTRWLQNLLRHTVLPRTKVDAGGRNAILTGLYYIGVILSALVAVSAAGLDLSILAYLAGALSIGLGFGLQNVVSNFVSGIILLIERPIKEGDWIEVSGHAGYVRKIAVRSTRIETFDRHDIIIPNSDLIAGSVKNMTMNSLMGRISVPVGVAYGSDLDRAKQILTIAAANHPMVVKFPEPNVFFMGLGDSAINLELRCYLHDVNNTLRAKSDLYFEIYRELRAAEIEIPFPQRDLTLRNLQPILDAIGTKSAGPQQSEHAN